MVPEKSNNIPQMLVKHGDENQGRIRLKNLSYLLNGGTLNFFCGGLWKSLLVGGFNPSEKYESKRESSPSRDEHTKIFENQHLVCVFLGDFLRNGNHLLYLFIYLRTGGYSPASASRREASKLKVAAMKMPGEVILQGPIYLL